MLPERVAEPVRRALAEHGLGRRIARVVQVGGGCINNGARIETETGSSFFLKWNASAPRGMFDAEADGLRALAAAATVRVPVAIAWSGSAAAETAESASWLLMEHVPPGRATRKAEARLGEGLAGLHRSEAVGSGAPFGWRRDNWIGSLPQANAPAESWADFWRDRRIAPQLERARRGGHLADRSLDRVVDLSHRALEDVETPELVHGDLWGGNWYTSEQGEPVLVDPAVYRGHGEVDLAMSELFGGFGASFYDRYRATHGVTDAYRAYRRDLYQLYYLLVHVNLFGASYEAGALRAARRVAAELSG